MRAYLNAFVDFEIVLHTVDTFHPRGAPASLHGTLLSVDGTTLRLRATTGDQVIALSQLVAFRPRDPVALPKEVASHRAPPTKTEVLEWMAEVQSAMKARRPEEEVRALLGKVIHGATRLLAKREDSDLAVAKERAEVILKKCSDPSLPPEE